MATKSINTFHARCNSTHVSNTMPPVFPDQTWQGTDSGPICTRIVPPCKTIAKNGLWLFGEKQKDNSAQLSGWDSIKVALSQRFANSRRIKQRQVSNNKLQTKFTSSQALAHSITLTRQGTAEFSVGAQKSGTRQGDHLPSGGRGNTGTTHQNIWHYTLHIAQKLQLLGCTQVQKELHRYALKHRYVQGRHSYYAINWHHPQKHNARVETLWWGWERPHRPNTCLMTSEMAAMLRVQGPFFSFCPHST